MNRVTTWGPAVLLSLGVLVTKGLDPSPGRQLRLALAEAIPHRIGDFSSQQLTIPAGELKVAGVTDYLARAYSRDSTSMSGAFTLYVGYYDRQVHGKTIHSPKNCLPGAGWEALQSGTTTVQTTSGPVVVNRYLIRKGEQQAVVLYWYQGRGRIQSSEYAVKWNLLRDSALRRRSDEALVRLVVPITESPDSVLTFARHAAETVIPGVNAALPG